MNPTHLEPVTPAENKRRHGLRRTHCPTGHPYDYFNTRIFNGYALCMTCDREAHRRKSLRARPRLDINTNRNNNKGE